MTAAPAAASIVPPTSASHVRQVTPSIRTHLMKRRDPGNGEHWVAAVYTATPPLLYSDPRDAPAYARIVPVGHGRRGKWNGKWHAHVQLMAVEQTETAALAALMAELDRAELPYEREQAQAVLLGLACATGDTPHALCPMGARRPKPRRKRHYWRNAEGKMVNIYADTLRRHADPRCICPDCTIFDRNPKPTTTETKAEKK